MKEILISVITPVYNRADKIHRVFESLEKSTFRNFELIIVDDGSIDNIEHVIERYRKKVSYPVTYIKKTNGGKHTALNILYLKAKGKYIFSLDSDDEIVPDAMEKALDIWNKIEKKHEDKYWCVVGRVANNKTRQMIGKLFPENINEVNKFKRKKILNKIYGDKWALQKADIVRKYKFPEPEGITFITESLVWNRIDKDYESYFTNDIFRIYYQNEGECLSNPKKDLQWLKNTYYNCMSILNDYGVFKLCTLEYIKNMTKFIFCSIMLKNEDMKKFGKLKLYNQLAYIIYLPIVYIFKNRLKSKLYD